jgi:hypothetical protein
VKPARGVQALEQQTQLEREEREFSGVRVDTGLSTWHAVPPGVGFDPASKVD